jgi:hypothetical protein
MSAEQVRLLAGVGGQRMLGRAPGGTEGCLVAIGGFFRDGGTAAPVDNFLTCRRSGVVQTASGPGFVFMRIGRGASLI